MSSGLGWRKVGRVKCVAAYNRTREKAERLAAEFGIPSVYDDPLTMLEKENLDFVDVITDMDTHSRFVHLAAEYKLPVICQKPLAPSLAKAKTMADACRAAGRNPNAILEQWPPPEATVEETIAKEKAWARQSINYLRTLIAD